MKTLFDCETEVAKCDSEGAGYRDFRYAEPDYATVYVHTVASLNERGWLKLEQNCFLRKRDENPEQHWVPPQIIWEQAPATEDAALELAKSLHEQFAEETLHHLPHEILA